MGPDVYGDIHFEAKLMILNETMSFAQYPSPSVISINRYFATPSRDLVN